MKLITIIFLMTVLAGCDQVSFTMEQATEANEKCKNNGGTKTILMSSFINDTQVNYITVTCVNEAVFYYKYEY